MVYFKDISHLWLKEKVGGNKKNYESKRDLVKLLNEDIGDLELTNSSKEFLSVYYNNLNKKSYKIGYAIAKENIKEILNDKGYTRQFLRKEKKIVSSTLSLMYRRAKISIKWAEEFCKKLNLQYDDFFENHITTKTYSANVITFLKTTLKSIINHAREKGILKKDFYFEYKQMAKRVKKQVQPMSNADLQNILTLTLNKKDDKKQVAIILSFLFNFNSNRVSALDWEDIDLSKKQVSSIKQQSYDNQIKDIKPMRIAIPLEVLNIIREFKRQQIRKNEAEGPLFTQKNGERVPNRTINFWLKQAHEETGQKDFDIKRYKESEFNFKYFNFNDSNEFLTKKELVQEMYELGFQNLSEYYDYLEFVNEVSKKIKKENEMEM